MAESREYVRATVGARTKHFDLMGGPLDGRGYDAPRAFLPGTLRIRFPMPCPCGEHGWDAAVYELSGDLLLYVETLTDCPRTLRDPHSRSRDQ